VKRAAIAIVNLSVISLCLALLLQFRGELTSRNAVAIDRAVLLDRTQLLHIDDLDDWADEYDPGGATVLRIMFKSGIVVPVNVRLKRLSGGVRTLRLVLSRVARTELRVRASPGRVAEAALGAYVKSLAIAVMLDDRIVRALSMQVLRRTEYMNRLKGFRQGDKKH